jgi:hypothetical protein
MSPLLSLPVLLLLLLLSLTTATLEKIGIQNFRIGINCPNPIKSTNEELLYRKTSSTLPQPTPKSSSVNFVCPMSPRP